MTGKKDTSAISAHTTSLLMMISCLLLTSAALAQSGAATADHQGGPGGAVQKVVHVPFKPGPYGPDGKVHQVPPVKVKSIPNETETLQVEEAKALAAAGLLTLTGKRAATVLSTEQLSLLQWNPGELKLTDASVLGSDEVTHAFHASGPPEKTAKPSSVPAEGADFSSIGYTGYIPPDGGVAAGSLQIVEVVNSNINVYDKNGNLLSSQTLNQFFSLLGVAGADFTFDPSIIYDMQTGRFWIVAVSENDAPNRSNILVAVSAADDLNQGWFQYWLDATVDGGTGTSNWCDHVHIGIDADAFYMSCNQFAFPRTGTSAGSFQYAKVRIMTKDELMTGACCSWWDYTNLSDSVSKSFTVRPAVERFTGHGFGDYWVNALGAGGSGGAVKVWQLTNPTACCDGSGGPTLTGSEQSVGTFGVPPAALQPNFAQGLDSGDTRVLFATYQFGHLSFGQNLACNQGGTNDACISFTELDLSAYPTMTTVNDWYLGQPAGEDLCYPFADQNINSDKAMVYTRSDTTSIYPGAYYITIPSSATCTFCVGGEVTMQAGTANYVNKGTGTKNRWGDYHGAGTDPDLLGIWVEGEYVASTNLWGTDIESSYQAYFPVDTPSVSTLDFGNQVVYTSSTAYVNFTNTGNAAMTTGNAYISGFDTDFAVTYSSCGGTVQPNNSCTVGVTFTPTLATNGSDLLALPDNTSAGITTVILSGNGLQAGTTVIVGSSPNPSTYGTTIFFNAQVVSATGGLPDGTVTFYDSSTALGTAPVGGGFAFFNTAALSSGIHNIVAVYSGSSNFTTSNSSLFQTVNPAATTSAITSSLNPSTYGTAVTFTAKVTSGVGTPTGSVTFMDGATALGTQTLSSGAAALSISTLAGGSHSITVVYSGSTNFAGSTSPALGQVVNPAATASMVTSSLNPSTFGTAVNFTAKVTSGVGTPTGTVNFMDGATNLGTLTLSSGTAALTISTLASGTHSITVVYSGSASFAGSTSSVLSQAVNGASTTSTVTSSVNPSTYGNPVTFTAKVTSSAGTPPGTVNFMDGATNLGTLTLSSGTAALTISTLASGTHSITVVYAGSAGFSGSTSSVLSQVVNPATTASAVSSSLSSSTYGTAVTFTAKVTSGAGVPTGSVTFNDGAITLGTQTLSSGAAGLTISTLAPGSHSITVAYGGSTNFAASNSSAITQTVTQAATTSAVTSSVNPSQYHETVTFTTKVISSGGVPAGTVTFKNGIITLGTATLASGSATLSTSALVVGKASITVVYSGNVDFLASTSAALTQTVNRVSTTTKVMSSKNPSKHGTAVTFTATVTPAFGGSATGKITFKDGRTNLGSGTIGTGNKATFTTSTLAKGTHSITAIYPGDANTNISTSAVVKQVVN